MFYTENQGSFNITFSQAVLKTLDGYIGMPGYKIAIELCLFFFLKETKDESSIEIISNTDKFNTIYTDLPEVEYDSIRCVIWRKPLNHKDIFVTITYSISQRNKVFEQSYCINLETGKITMGS